MKVITKIQSKQDLSLHENELASVLSRAFYNDPYYVHIMPNDKKRIAQIKWWQKILLRYTLKYGSIYTTDDYTGVAMWVGPDKPLLDDFQFAMLGFIFYPFKVGIRNFIRLLYISGEWSAEHKKQNKRHYYLMVVGVEPDLQKQGIGSQLIRDILQKADEEKLDCFLETVEYANVIFYMKHNFEVIYNKEFGKNYQYWLMKRTQTG